VRLSKERKEIVGTKATIYETEYEGSLAFLLVLDKSQVKQTGDNSIESRLTAIECKIDEVLSGIKSNNPKKTNESTNAHTPGQIRTAVAGSKVLHD
jgi:hypothetical protein